MHFNTKYIFAGDSASEIKRKINYNFDQILSFAVGPNGHQGTKGPNGYDGPSGKKGLTGPTGLRGTLWSKVDDAPTSGNPFDLWIDSNTSDYQVYSLGATGSWSYSGYSLFTSPYFAAYDGIIGPAGVTDKYAIGIKNGALNESNTSLVIGDDYATISGINPNRSKLLVSTDDQITRPILTFSKTGAISSGVPSFYWRSTGNSASLRYTSTGNFEISSLLGLSIDSYTARSLLYGDHAVITSLQDVTIGGTGDFYLKSNTTVGVGGNLSITSSNITLSSTNLSSRIPIKIQNINNPLTYVFDSIKNTSSGTSTSGISILASSTQDSAFEFFDLKNAPIFSAKPRGSVSSGKHAQTTFGSTGGQPAGATGGPYLYPVKRVREVRSPSVSVTAFQYGVTPKTSSIAYNVIDLTSLSLWDSNIILVTPTSYKTVVFQNQPRTPFEVFLQIPTFADNNADGLYNNGYSNTYRIFLNDLSANQYYKINGLVFNYWKRNFLNGTLTPETYFVRFKYQPPPGAILVYPIQSCYVDLTFVGVASTTNGNPRVFWKTCDGISGYISITDRYSLGSIVVTGPNQGGTVVLGPGAGGGASA
jgi:hypothetical protein